MLKYAAYSFRSSAIAAFHNTSEAVNAQIMDIHLPGVSGNSRLIPGIEAFDSRSRIL